MQNNILDYFGLDIESLKTTIENSKKLEDDKTFFEQLSSISVAKKTVADALEMIESYERDAKGLINSKAKALYGNDWQVIKGDSFKISRSYTGTLYEIADAEMVDPDFLKVKFTPDSKNIETFRETHENSLPEGITINEHRGETIKVTVNENR